MKKIIAVILALVLCLGLIAGCGKAKTPDITIEQLYKANTKEELFKQGDIIHTKNTFHTEYGDDYETCLTKDTFYYSYENDYVISGFLKTEETDYDYSYDKKSGEERFFQRVYFMSDEDKKEYRPPLEKENLYGSDFTTQVIKDIKDNGDGTYTITAEYNPAILFDDGYLPEEFEGGNVKDIITVNKDSLRIIKSEDIIVTKDGKEIPYSTSEISFAESVPELQKKMEERAATVGKEDPRMVTMVYDYGTEKQAIYQVQLDKKTHCYMFTLDKYALFADQDGTTEFVGNKGMDLGDVVIYAFPMKGQTLAEFMGNWSDSVTEHASMEITAIDKGTDAHITIWWGSSENDTPISVNWEFDAVYDKDSMTLTSENGVKKVLKYVDGAEKEEIVAEKIFTEVFFNATNDLVLWCEDEDLNQFIFKPYAF